MFPAGAAGWGLLLLRVCAAGMLAHLSIANESVPIATWEVTGTIILAGALCLGAFTPVVCSISAVLQVLMVLRAHQPDPFQFAFSLSVTVVVFLLGPGAFSLDSHLFGRRLIVHTDSK